MNSAQCRPQEVQSLILREDQQSSRITVRRGIASCKATIVETSCKRRSKGPGVATTDIFDFRLLAENIPHIVWAASPDGSTQYFNEVGATFTGLPVEANYGWGWVSLIHPDDAKRATRDWDEAQELKIPFYVEWRVRRADGKYRWMAIRGVPVFNVDGPLMQWVGTCTDIEDNKRLEQHLVEAERSTAESLTLLETLMSTAPVGLGFIDREFRIIRMNSQLAAVNGASVEDQLGRTVAEVVPGLWHHLEPLYRRVLDTGEAIRNREVSGETAEQPGYLHHWLVSYFPVPKGRSIVGIGIVVVDITDRLQAEEFRAIVLNHMAEGLYTLDNEGLLTSINAAGSKALGWSADELLGKSMHDVVHFQREDGTTIPQDECELLQVRTEGRSIRLDNEVFTRRDGSMFPVACSFAPLLTGTAAQGAVVVFRDITEERSEQLRVQRELAALSWVGRIREAIDENRLVLYSQPIVPLTGGQPIEELLLRMIGRSGEIILPGAFLPVAEKYGLISEIDRWVVRKSIEFASTGRRVEANVSAASMTETDLLEGIEEEIRRSGADPANLVFEITETALMRDLEKGEAFAHALAKIGCGLALDDFGTGFGTFTYMKRLSFNYIKIDVEFVRDLGENSANQHIVKAIVDLAHGFGVQTIAEGVEDGATLKVIRDLRVDFAQGFYLGSPAPLRQTEN